MTKFDCRGLVPESWDCIDCGVNTAPGCSTRAEVEQAFAANTEGVRQTFNDQTEVYTVKPAVWKEAGMGDFDGCLCIGCLEKRIARTLTPKDFDREHPFHLLPGTKRLLERRDVPMNRHERRVAKRMEARGEG
jgi:hypothetical protein